MNNVDIDTMTDAYIECALWSSTHFEDESDNSGKPMDQLENDLSEEASKQMRKDCADFLELLEREEVEIKNMDDAQVGHDFWLTRNGHGAGFWDRGLGELGETLSKLAKSYGSCDLYLGDDELIHVA